MRLNFRFSWELQPAAQSAFNACLAACIQDRGALAVPRAEHVWLLVVQDAKEERRARLMEQDAAKVSPLVNLAADKLLTMLAALPGQGLVGAYVIGDLGYTELLSITGSMEAGHAQG